MPSDLRTEHALPGTLVAAMAAVVAMAATSTVALLPGLVAKLTALLAVGAAICGVSAIAAIAPALKPRQEETAYALACVAVFGLVATLLYPVLLGFWWPEGHQAGLVLGAAIHDTAQVTAAALMFEQAFGNPATLAAATVTKLLRNLSMLLVIPAVTWWALRAQPASSLRPAFPLFIIGFLAMAAVRSAGDALLPDNAVWRTFLASAGHTSAFLFAMAVAAIGMGIRIDALRKLGPRPAIVAVLTALGMLATALATAALIG